MARDPSTETYGVGEVARIAGVTVRALHHYDEIGLLRPSMRTDAGYRRYTRADLLRLQRIRLFRALDFGLEDVRALLGAPDAELRAALAGQRAALLHRLEETESLVAIIDRVLDGTREGREAPEVPAEDLFNGFQPDEYAAEARERWGSSDAYQESARRAASYSADDWKEMAAEAKAINDALLARMASGAPPGAPEVTALAEEHRQHIGRWFYECNAETHVGLAEMYIADPRFTAHYDAQAPGFAQYVADAIRANAQRDAA